jgi:L-ribulose-5-phosphate 4-epimerase
MLEELKQRVWQVAQDTMTTGLVQERGGNFSIYDHDSGYVLITPGGIYRAVLQPEDIAVVTLDGEMVEGDKKPSSETPMHTGIYRGKPELGGIVHTHSSYGCTFAALNREIPAILPSVLVFGRTIPVAPFAMPGTLEMAEVILPFLEDHAGVLLQNHGVVTVADTIEEALLKAIYLEEVAKVYHQALLLGEPGLVPEKLAKRSLTKRGFM